MWSPDRIPSAERNHFGQLYTIYNSVVPLLCTVIVIACILGLHNRRMTVQLHNDSLVIGGVEGAVYYKDQSKEDECEHVLRTSFVTRDIFYVFGSIREPLDFDIGWNIACFCILPCDCENKSCLLIVRTDCIEEVDAGRTGKLDDRDMIVAW